MPEVGELLGERRGRVEAVASEARRIHRAGSRRRCPRPAMRPALHERVDEGLAERRVGLDDPDPRADVQDALEDADDVVAAAERGPEAEQHDLDADEDAEQACWPSPGCGCRRPKGP